MWLRPSIFAASNEEPEPLNGPSTVDSLTAPERTSQLAAKVPAGIHGSRGRHAATGGRFRLVAVRSDSRLIRECHGLRFRKRRNTGGNEQHQHAEDERTNVSVRNREGAFAGSMVICRSGDSTQC